MPKKRQKSQKSATNETEISVFSLSYRYCDSPEPSVMPRGKFCVDAKNVGNERNKRNLIEEEDEEGDEEEEDDDEEWKVTYQQVQEYLCECVGVKKWTSQSLSLSNHTPILAN